MEQCCGNCKWSTGKIHADDDWTDCVYPLPNSVPEASRFEMMLHHGIDCPCFTPREEAGS